MSVTWASLFERGDESAVSIEDVREELERRRESGGDRDGSDDASDDAHVDDGKPDSEVADDER